MAPVLNRPLILVLSQAELGMHLKTQLNWDQNYIFAEWKELDIKSAIFDLAQFWVLDFESINTGILLHEMASVPFIKF